MAVTLSEFKFGWKALNAALNKIVDAINRNAPLEGEGIHLDEKGQGGVSINATQNRNNAQNQQQGGGGPGADGHWMPVTIVDPDTCQQTQIQVWAK